MANYHQRARDLTEQVFEYVKRSGDYKGYISEEEFDCVWKGIQEIVTFNKQSRDRRQEIIDSALSYWVDEGARAWIQTTDMSRTLLEAVRQVAKRMPFTTAIQQVNSAVVKRIQNLRRGVSNAKYSITGDWNAALKATADAPRLD